MSNYRNIVTKHDKMEMTVFVWKNNGLNEVCFHAFFDNLPPRTISAVGLSYAGFTALAQLADAQFETEGELMERFRVTWESLTT